MRKRPILTTILTVVLLAGFIAYREAGRAPTHSSLKTFTSDLVAARRQSGERYEQYSYRLTKYAEEALRGMPWQEVLDSLRAQGAEFEEFDRDPSQIIARFPKCDFKLGGGLALRPTVVLQKQVKVDPRRRTWIGCTPNASLELELRRPFAKVSAKDLPKDSLLRQIFERPGLAGVASKYPWFFRASLTFEGVGAGSSRYMSSLPPAMPMPQMFSVSIECAREDMCELSDTVVSYSAPSEIEPVPRRIISWLPIQISTAGKDFLKISGTDNVARLRDATPYYALQKEGFRTREQWDAPTAYSNPDLEALPVGTEKLTMDYSSIAIDYSILRRFPNLKELHLRQIRLAPTDVARIAALKSLTTLETTVTRRADLVAFLKMPQLTTLNVVFPGANVGDLALMCANPRLKKFSILGMAAMDDATLLGFCKLPRIRSATWGSGSKVSMRGFQAVIDAKRYRRLTISMNMLPKDAVDQLPKITTLVELNLSNATVSEKTIRALAALPNLRVISFSMVKGLTDAGLMQFAQNKHLDLISVNQCAGVTAAGFRALKAKLGTGYRGPFTVPQ